MIHFEETQLLRRVWWYWIVFIPFALLGVWGLVNLVGSSDPAKINDTLIIVCSIPIALTVFCSLVTLKTEVNENAIVIKVFPFLIKRTIPWSQISKAFVLKYELNEFKATGSGAIPFGNGKAYHLYSGYGLQLETMEGNKILIGTRKPKSLQEFLKAINKL